MGAGHLLHSSRLFMYSGIFLVVIAVTSFPMKIPIQAQPGDVDYFGVGWLFAPIIGIWGFAGIVLGLVHSSSPKSAIRYYLLPVLALVTVGLAYAIYMVIFFGSGLIHGMGRGESFWWLYFLMILIPSLLIYFLIVKFLRSEGPINLLASPKVQIALIVTLVAVPLFYAFIFLLLMYLF